MLKYQDGIQVAAYKPKYALNLSFDAAEFQIYLGYLLLLSSAFTLLNYIVGWEIQASWLGFAIAFLNYSTLGKVFGLRNPSHVFVRARVVLSGSPEQIAQAFSETHCELDELRSSGLSPLKNSPEALHQKIQIQQFLLTL